MTVRWPILLVLLLSASCSDERVQPIDVNIAAAPRVLDFGAVFIGETSEREVELRNHSPVAAELELTVDGHFRVQPSQLHLAPGEHQTVVVVYKPGEVGEHFATLRLPGPDVAVVLQGIGADRHVAAL